MVTEIRGPALEPNSISEITLANVPLRNLNKTLNVNFSTAQSLVLYQSDSGHKSRLQGVIVLITSSVGVSTNPSMSVGTVAGGGNNLFANQTMPITTVGQSWVFWNIDGSGVVIGDTASTAAEVIIIPANGVLMGSIYLLGSIL